ncbi:MAG: phosphoesterase PA-phosphatase related [Hyphomicrobiales bacterium]|nr:phosphoesterase PA-phosphatase related [Hyphomicrobiales bacterium]
MNLGRGRVLPWLQGNRAPMLTHFSKALSYAARLERGVLAVLALVATGLFAFVQLADEVMEGSTHGFDSRVLLMFRNPQDLSDPIGPRWFEEVMRDFTALGGTAVLTLLTVFVTLFLVLAGKRRSAMLVAGSIVLGTIFSTVLKLVFDRPRPDLVPHGMDVYTLSFPSSHAMMSAMVYLTLGALLARTQADLRVRLYLICCAILLTLLIGISRVYLGVHWPTDVLAGWAVGSCWALLSWLLARRLQSTGPVEPPGQKSEKGDAGAPPLSG